MQRIQINPNNWTSSIAAATAVLSAGGLVIFPTETTYGAGVDATNPDGVAKLLAYKARREGKPLSIAVPTQTAAEQYVELTDSARKLYAQFLPGPVTVVSKSRGGIAAGVESEFGTLGVRIPDYPFMLELLAAYGKPITATSANMSDGARPYNIDKLLADLPAKQLGLIDLILDAGELPHNEPSTVIDTTLSTPLTMRAGELTAAATLSAALENTSAATFTTTSAQETSDLAGKLLLKHWNTIKASGLVIGLDGPLGAGKTVFTKGVAQFLGITETISSPTYSYINEHEYLRHDVAGMLYHLDVWKIDDAETFARLEFENLLKPRTVVVVEWWDQVKAFVQPPRLLTITIADPNSNTERQITVYE